MANTPQDIIALEQRFWNSMVDEDTETALALLSEPSTMVSEHGAMQFDHAAYRKMAEQGAMVVKSYELRDMKVLFPREDLAILTYKVTQALAKRGEDETTEQEMTDSSVWSRQAGSWRCVMHTETPAAGKGAGKH